MNKIRLGFIWGTIFTLFTIIIMAAISLVIFNYLLNFSILKAFIYTTFTLIVCSIMLELGILLYYFTQKSPGFNKKERIEELRIRLNAIETARKETQKKYYKRELGDDAFEKIMERLEAEKTEIKSELEALKGSG